MSYKQGRTRAIDLIESASVTLSGANQLWFGSIRNAIYDTVIIQTRQISAGSATFASVIFDGTTPIPALFEAITTYASAGATSASNDGKVHNYIFGNLDSFVAEASKNIMLNSDDVNVAARAIINAAFPNSWAEYDPVALIGNTTYTQKPWGGYFCPAVYFNSGASSFTGEVRVFGVRTF